MCRIIEALCEFSTKTTIKRMSTSSGGTPAWKAAYTHDAVGNRLSKALGGEAEAYLYDAGSRLIAGDRSGPTPRSWSWAFDLVGNRTQQRVDGNPRSMTHDVRNRLLTAQGGGLVRVEGHTTEAATVSVDGHPARMLPDNAFEADVPRTPGQTTFAVEARDTSGNLRMSTYQITTAADGATYTYDGVGNLASRTDATGAWTYEWNGVNQLTRVMKDSAEIARFEYDPLGRRVRKIAAGVTTSFTYDGADIRHETRTSGTSLTYIHGPGIDEPLAWKTGSGEMSYVHADGLGSIIRVTNPAGTVVSEPPRVSWRAHSLRGWSPWPERVDIHRKFASVLWGWCASTRPSTDRSGLRSARWRKNSAARPRLCGAGCARPSETRVFVQA